MVQIIMSVLVKLRAIDYIVIYPVGYNLSIVITFRLLIVGKFMPL